MRWLFDGPVFVSNKGISVLHRLRYIEKDRAGWEVEKSKLVEDKNNVTVDKVKVEHELRDMKAELSGLHAQLEQLKLQQEKEKAFSMYE